MEETLRKELNSIDPKEIIKYVRGRGFDVGGELTNEELRQEIIFRDVKLTGIFNDADQIIRHLRLQDIDIAEQLTDSELRQEISHRGIDLSDFCEKQHLDEHPNQVTLPGDEEKMIRFSEVQDKLKWEQWNDIFCKLEKLDEKHLKLMPSKYDKL